MNSALKETHYKLNLLDWGCVSGAVAHADILKLVATLLVLQLMRVMKMVDGEIFQSLFRLTDQPEPRQETLF